MDSTLIKVALKGTEGISKAYSVVSLYHCIIIIINIIVIIILHIFFVFVYVIVVIIVIVAFVVVDYY